MIITAPGVYEMTAEEYLADPVRGGSLSSSGARLLLSTCPAMFQHRRQYPDTPTGAMTLGTAAHALILGTGRTPVEIPDDVLAVNGATSTKLAREWIAKAEAEGKTPLKAREMRRIEKMAGQIRKHPRASQLLMPGSGQPERVLVWRDETTGVWCRAMIDWLRRDGRIVDYKTGESASERAFRAAVTRYRYDQQDAWYRAGVKALGVDPAPEFEFVVQETTTPYLVATFQLDPIWVASATSDNRAALDLYKRCQDTDEWPGYPPDTQTLIAPTWMIDDFLELT